MFNLCSIILLIFILFYFIKKAEENMEYMENLARSTSAAAAKAKASAAAKANTRYFK